MMRRVGKRLPNLGRDLIHRPLTLRQHIDNLGAPPVPERVGDGRERVEEGVLRLPVSHRVKISLEYMRIKRKSAFDRAGVLPGPVASRTTLPRSYFQRPAHLSPGVLDALGGWARARAA